MTRAERFLERVTQTDDCWIWRGNIDTSTGRPRYSHAWANRVAYELFVEPIPVGAQVHHICRNPLCVNPTHLEALTGVEHRARHRDEVCPRNHRPNWRTTRRGTRVCRDCDRERVARARAGQRPRGSLR